MLPDDSLAVAPNEVTADAYFAIVPEWLLDASSSNAVKLYAILRRYADKGTSEAHPSRKTLAKRMGFSRPQSVDPIVAELIRVGALAVFERWTNRGDRDSNGYRLFMQPNGVGAQTARPVGVSRRRPVGGQSAHNPESQEPESVEPEIQDSSSSVTEVDARSGDDDRSYPQVPPHLVDTGRVHKHLSAMCGRDVEEATVFDVVSTILAKAKTFPSAPTRYVLASITRDPVGWQNYLDSGKAPTR